MSRRFAKAAPAAALVCGLTAALAWGQALAWGPLGHRVTGDIAERCLSPRAAAAVRELLGVEDLAEASTWADFMRSSDDPFWRAAGPWHYVTVPPGQTYDPTAAPREGDAFTALAGFRATLRDPTQPRSDRIRALRFAVHVIGDLHQPLHAGNGLDRGGNDYPVTFFGRPTNLHQLWDTLLPEREELSYSEYAHWLHRRLTRAQVEQWNTDDAAVWIRESVVLRDRVYPPEPEASLGWDYVYAHRADMRGRLTQAGVRIATWLDVTFVPPNTPADRVPRVTCTLPK